MTDVENAGTPRTQPALRALQHDQRALLDGGRRVEHGLRDGFPTLRAALEWYQRTIPRTLGEISEPFPPGDLVRDRTLASSLVVGRERETLAESPPSLTAAADYRDRLERLMVIPAAARSYNRLRLSAGEYLQDSEISPERVDAAEQDHVAMRPSISRKDVEQAAALRELWGGFETDRELNDWTHDLLEPSNGSISKTLAAEIGRDSTARAMLVRDERPETITELSARRWRERFAALIVLPAFVRGIRRMDCGELVQEGGEGLTAPMG